MKNKRIIFTDLNGLASIAKECLDINGKPVPKYKGQLTTELKNLDELNIDQRLTNKEYLADCEQEGHDLIDQLLQCAWRLGYDACEANELKHLREVRDSLMKLIKIDTDKKIVI